MLWKIQQKANNELVQELKESLPYSESFIQLCLNRGLTSVSEIESFIQPNEQWFHDPFEFFEMNKTVERIYEALEKNESVLIYGDYDADGVTSTTILYETLLTLGMTVSYYIPDRFEDGYGPNIERYKEAIEQGVQLIITVDNGVAGHEAIEYAKEQSVDVIVTDHHELPEKLPNAYSIIHPKHPEGNYPFKELAGVGVALKTAQAILGELPTDFLDLAAIGTVADMVSLTGENRAIVYYGLKMLRQTQRMGLRQLIVDLGIKPSEVDEKTIGFQIAPVMNTAGRLEQANIVVELLSSFDEEVIQSITKHLIEINEQRKDIVKTIVEEAMNQIEPTDEINILKSEHWHEGVLGLVASRLVRETAKPTIVLKEFPERGYAKGSARSVDNFDLYQECNEVRDLFTHFGGHQMAAGMTLLIENINPLKIHLSEQIKELKKTVEIKPAISIEGTLDVGQVDLDYIKEINLLKPFGMDNPLPTYLFKQVNIQGARRIGKDKTHLKMTIKEESTSLDTIGFSFGNIVDFLSESSKIDVVGQIETNEWNGNKKPQLLIEDIKLLAPKLIDRRTSQLKKTMFELEQVTYVCFSDRVLNTIQPLLKESSTAINHVDLLVRSNQDSHYILVDCPSSLEDLAKVVQAIGDQKITIYFYKKHSLYLNGLPTKEQCATVYKYIATHPVLPVQNLSKSLSDYLNMSDLTFNLIIKLFLDANFVKIEDGQLCYIQNDEKINLVQTKRYKAYQSLMKLEEQLLFSSKDELVQLINELNNEE